MFLYIVFFIRGENMETLKKGIIFGLGLAETTNKKQVEDFALKLYKSGYLTKRETADLIKTILLRAKEHNRKIESHVENYVRTILKRDISELLEKIDILEKRIELLEEDVDDILLNEDVEEMDDKEFEDFLKEIGINPKEYYDKDKKEENLELNDLNKKEDDFDNDFVDDLLNATDDELEALLEKEFGSEKNTKKIPIKKPKSKKSTKKKTSKKKSTKSKKTTKKK